MTIIERILQTAEKKDIKQSTIAKHIGKNNNQVTSWKERNCNPPAELLPPIAELLGVSIQWLMTGEEQAGELPTEEKELLNEYRQLPPEEREEVRNIVRMKLDKIKSKEGKILNSEIA